MTARAAAAVVAHPRGREGSESPRYREALAVIDPTPPVLADRRPRPTASPTGREMTGNAAASIITHPDGSIPNSVRTLFIVISHIDSSREGGCIRHFLREWPRLAQLERLG